MVSDQRRRILQTVVGGVMVGIAGCTGGGGDNGSDGSAPGGDNSSDGSGSSGDGSGERGGGDSSGNADSWTHPRHYNAANSRYVADSPLLSSNSFSKAWETEIVVPKCPFNSHIVINDGLFVANPADGNTVYCVDERSGSKQWEYTVESNRVRIGPFVDGVVYIFGDKFIAIDAKTGSERWKNSAPLISSSVKDGVIFGEKVKYEGDSRSKTLAALNADDGSEMWVADQKSIEIDKLSNSHAVGNNAVYGVMKDATIAAYDTETGEKKWVTDAAFQKPSPPSVGNGNVYIYSKDGLVAINAESGDKQWTQPHPDFSIGEISTDPPIIGDKTVFVQLGENLYAHSASDGSQKWNYDGRLDEMICDGETLYGTTGGGNTRASLVALDPADGSKKWEYTAPEGVSIDRITKDTFYGCPGFAPDTLIGKYKSG